MRKAIFPGSFDPITNGHYDIIKRALPLFDEIVIAIGVNAEKRTMFSVEERKKFIEATFQDESQVSTTVYEGLTVDLCKRLNAGFILRGLRNAIDFEYENSIAQANSRLTGIESVFLVASAPVSYISSSIVRDVIRNKGDYTIFVPDNIKLNIKK